MLRSRALMAPGCLLEESPDTLSSPESQGSCKVECNPPPCTPTILSLLPHQASLVTWVATLDGFCVLFTCSMDAKEQSMADMWENNFNKSLITGLIRASNTLIYMSRLQIQCFLFILSYSLFCYYCYCCFEIESHCVVPDDLELIMKTMMALNLWRSTILCLSSAEIKSVSHHTQSEFSESN